MKEKRLTEEEVMQFHHTVTQLLIVSLKAQNDIQTKVASLSTRIKSPDKNDWTTLKK